MSKKINLVLEGGGMRGSYTAGALAWMLDNNISFESAFAISTGAVHLSSFLLGKKEELFKLPCVVLPSANCVGFKAFLKEGRYVAYDYVFNDILEKQFNFDLEPLKKHKTKINIGLYDVEKGECLFYDNQLLSINMLKAACSLPIVSKVVKLAFGKFLDGGITTMIPIEESLKNECDNHLVICTKPQGYIRKKSPWLVSFLMRLVYFKYPQISKDYKVRANNYNKQMDIIEKLVDNKKALLIRPSQKLKVKRFKGDQQALEKLFYLGYQDMEKNRKEIIKMFGNEH